MSFEDNFTNSVKKIKERAMNMVDFHNTEKHNNYDHLQKDIKPIFVCVGEYEEHINESKNLYKVFHGGPVKIKNVEDVDYSGNPDILKEKGMKNAGRVTYVISQIDSFDKFSREYFDCIGLIAAGKDKITNENISFITHQDPKTFLYEKKENFIKDLDSSLDELKKRSTEKAIDVVIIGGQYDGYDEHYVKSIKLLEQRVFKKFGFYPVIAIGPKISDGSDTIFYDNKNRRVFVGRQSIEKTPFTAGYVSKDLKKNLKKWRA